MELAGTPETPAGRSNAAAFADLSPPSSQDHTSIAAGSTNTSSPSVPNANGKRPLSTLESNHDMAQPTIRPAVLSPGATTNGQSERQTHQPSGYTWTLPEDAPGYGWRNKRAMEEAERAWTQVLNKERRVANRYGDPFEMADREAAMLAEQQKPA